ncbi:MAG: DUF2062 domain-containing protein [Victivallales bacterium]|nr:DUF2062 domain-containing protein [Victivallales bacterium]
MNTLILTSIEPEEMTAFKSLPGHFLASPQESPPFNLLKAAGMAENNDCPLILDLGACRPSESIAGIAASVAAATPSPTEITVIHGGSRGSTPSPNAKRAAFLIQMLTGEDVCGFRSKTRIYPAKLLLGIDPVCFGCKDFFSEVLVLGSRAGYKVSCVEADACGSPDMAPVPGVLFFLRHMLRRLLPWPSKRLCKKNFKREKMMDFLLHPIEFLKFLLKENASPEGLALAAAAGMFLGTLPLLGLHTAAIIYVSIKLRLNKILAVNISHLCMPPLVPLACIQTGYYIRHGQWLTSASFHTVLAEAHLRLLEWFLGALILAPFNAVFFAATTYLVAKALRHPVSK